MFVVGLYTRRRGGEERCFLAILRVAAFGCAEREVVPLILGDLGREAGRRYPQRYALSGGGEPHVVSILGDLQGSVIEHLHVVRAAIKDKRHSYRRSCVTPRLCIRAVPIQYREYWLFHLLILFHLPTSPFTMFTLTWLALLATIHATTFTPDVAIVHGDALHRRAIPGIPGTDTAFIQYLTPGPAEYVPRLLLHRR